MRERYGSAMGTQAVGSLKPPIILNSGQTDVETGFLVRKPCGKMGWIATSVDLHELDSLTPQSLEYLLIHHLGDAAILEVGVDGVVADLSDSRFACLRVVADESRDDIATHVIATHVIAILCHKNFGW